jgi:hypothetical protein
MEHTKHIWRFVLLILSVGMVFVMGRHFLIPASFGVAGHYRLDSTLEIMAQEPVHGNTRACAPCHEEQFDAKAEGKHAVVQCAVCHGPVTIHVTDGVKTAEMPTNPSNQLCGNCHQELEARPETMPQIDLREHLIVMEVMTAEDDIPDGACIMCHDVHNPSI